MLDVRLSGSEKLSVDGTGADGKAASWNYTAAYDGKSVSQGHRGVSAAVVADC